MNSPKADDEVIPTATVEDRVDEYLYVDDEVGKMIFKNPTGAKFAIIFPVKMLPAVNVMCWHLMAEWHLARPDKGLFIRPAGEVKIHASDEHRGKVIMQFDNDIGHVLSAETALEVAKLLVQTVERTETEDERKARLLKKAPMLFRPSKPNIIKP